MTIPPTRSPFDESAVFDESDEADARDVVRDAERTVAIDPVCGAAVDLATRSFAAVFDGDHYRFCSETCRARFQRDPARYVVSWVETL